MWDQVLLKRYHLPECRSLKKRCTFDPTLNFPLRNLYKSSKSAVICVILRSYVSLVHHWVNRHLSMWHLVLQKSYCIIFQNLISKDDVPLILPSIYYLEAGINDKKYAVICVILPSYVSLVHHCTGLIGTCQCHIWSHRNAIFTFHKIRCTFDSTTNLLFFFILN